MSEAETLQSLDNVLTRLALTSESNLQQVLWKLIPAVIRQLKFPAAAIRNKVLQILSHVNKRLDVRDDDITLPLVDLVTLLQEADREQQATIRSFALVYIEKASEKTTPDARRHVLPHLLTNLAARPMEQRTILLRVAMTCLEDCPASRPSELIKKQKTSAEDEMFNCLHDPADRTAFVEFASWTLLFQTKQRATIYKELVHNGESVVAPPQVQDVLTAVASGMSLERMRAVEGKMQWTDERLRRRKVGILNYVREIGLGRTAFLPFLIASVDGDEEVNRTGKALLKKHFRIEQDSKDLDLNDPELIREVFRLFQGTIASGQLPTEQNVTSYCTPASHALKASLLGLLNKSTEAANHYPDNIQVIWSCIFGKQVPMSLRLQAMEFSVWVVKHANAETLDALAEPMLNELLGFMHGDISARQKGYVYDAIGQLAQRLPSVFQGKIQIAEDLFAALETEPPGVKSQLQSAVATLSGAYQATDPAIQELLMNSIESSSSAVRLTAVTWSMRLFPFRNPMARTICIVGAGDGRSEVQSEAQLGLDPVSFSRESTSGKAAAYPSVSELLQFLKENSLWVKRRLDQSDNIYQVLISFLATAYLASSDADRHLPHVELTELLVLFKGALTMSASSALIIEAMEAMVSLLMSNRDAMSQWCMDQIPDFKKWLFHTNNAVRVPSAQLIGIAAAALTPAAILNLIEEFRGVLCAVPKSKFEARSGAIQALGYVAASNRNEEVTRKLLEVTRDAFLIYLDDADPHLATTAALAIGHQLLNPAFCAALVNVAGLETFFDTVCPKLQSFCRHSDLHVASTAVLATGLICKGLEGVPHIEQRCLMDLLSLQDLKSDERQCSIGEAMALGFAKDTISSDWILLFNYSCLRKLPIDLASLGAPKASEDVHGGVIDALLKGMMHSRTENRAACVGHLVALFTYVPRHPSLLQRLEAAQNGFLGLLGDRNALTQEMASRGVSLVYRQGSADAKAQLLSGLTSVLKDPTKRGAQVKVDADTEVFSEGELGKAPGGGQLTTYKELCSLATDMGQPDLLYKFMDLANHQAALQSRRGAAAGFGHIAEMAGEDLKPYLSSLLPRIYRLQFDPNPSVQETMQNIWQSLLPRRKDAIDEHLDGIFKELLTEITGRQWRNRESSCRALSEVLQGRTWPQLRDVLCRMWSLAFRAADDIKESVRVAGVQLLKTLKRVTLRFADPQVMSSDIVSEVVGQILPVLLEVVHQPKVPENVAVAFLALKSIAASCPQPLLRPHLSLLIPTLLEGLSNLEPSMVDELQLMVEGFGLDGKKIEAIRVQAAGASPLNDILQRCLRATDASALPELMPPLREVIQRGVGLQTRVGTARFVAQVAAHVGSDFEPYASKILKLYLTKTLSGEGSTALKKTYAATVGAVSKVASLDVVGKMLRQCLAATEESVSVALILRELHLQAPQKFSTYAAQIVPVAFLRRFDTSSPEAASMWSAVLEKGMGTENGAVRLYHAELIHGVTEAFRETRWTAKVAASRVIERLYEVDKEIVASYSAELLRLLLDQMPGRIWDGKEALMKAIAKICSETPTMVHEHAARVIQTLKEACGKGKKIYRETALDSLVDVVGCFDAKEGFVADLLPFFLSAARESEEEAEKKLPLGSVMKGIAHLRSGLPLEPFVAYDAQCFALFHETLSSQRPWQLKLSALESLGTFLAASQFDPSDLSAHLEQLTTGVFVCLDEPKYEQLRLKALEALDSIRQTATRHGNVSLLADLEQRLRVWREREKSLAVKIRAETLLGQLKETTTLH